MMEVIDLRPVVSALSKIWRFGMPLSSKSTPLAIVILMPSSGEVPAQTVDSRKSTVFFFSFL